MYPFKIGVMLDSFRLPIDQALVKAAEVGGQGLQVYATYGQMAPENLTRADRREFLNKVKAQGLVISALCGDLGKGFTNPELNPGLIEKSKRILDLAVEAGIVTKSGAFFSYQDQRLAQGRDNARTYLKEHPEITEEIDQQVRARLFAPKSLTPDEEKAMQDQSKEEEDDLALLDEDI